MGNNDGMCQGKLKAEKQKIASCLGISGYLASATTQNGNESRNCLHFDEAGLQMNEIQTKAYHEAINNI